MTRPNPITLVAACVISAISSNLAAEVTVKTPGHDVRVGSGGISVRAEGINSIATDGNSASVTVGGIDEDVDIQGVTVINGRVSIDGKEIPPGVTRYKSPRTGTVYLIQRKNGAVNVTTDEGSKK